MLCSPNICSYFLFFFDCSDIHAFLAWFDISFECTHKKVRFSTGPHSPYTHWKSVPFLYIYQKHCSCPLTRDCSGKLYFIPQQRWPLTQVVRSLDDYLVRPMPETTGTLISVSPTGLKVTLMKVMCNTKCSCFLTILYIVISKKNQKKKNNLLSVFFLSKNIR